MKYCSQLSDIPKEPHFAILQGDSTYIEGDERSRTNLGHGYPAHTSYHLKYIAFTDKEELNGWIEQNETSRYGKKEYRVIEAKPKTVKLKVGVNLD